MVGLPGIGKGDGCPPGGNFGGYIEGEYAAVMTAFPEWRRARCWLCLLQSGHGWLDGLARHEREGNKRQHEPASYCKWANSLL